MKFDVNGDETVDLQDRSYWVHELKNTWFGDSNLDGVFDSSDFVAVFKAGEYEDGIAMNSTWSTGDWNGDREFDSGDFVFAFKDGGYEQGARPATHAVPEPSSAVLILLAIAGVFRLRK
ncbi:MAG: PEP-CTERM sorting domain-containing protein [Planctomycetales bacterium]|nr:PEP-CTERM sorting domain-containing protein [Planctomycetales bacterium]